MSPATSAAAFPGVLLLQSPVTMRPFPTARLLPSGPARPLKVTSAPRRLLAMAVRAQGAINPGYLPESEFYKIEAILRPWRVHHVSSGLLEMGIRGVTVSEVRGFGAQGGSTERHEGMAPPVAAHLHGSTIDSGSEFSEDTFITKVKMEIVVCKEQVEAVIDKIIEKARTGEIGDGKIFLVPVSEVVRIRTGERGKQAERMAGGLSDRLSSVVSIS
ncbi:nitrogen regulatory protein P-II homolog isoform X1 [Phragmites australis]|uniref:nitrogen regulatory protein P-II homolog isoform X1 n=1 Tax=Phragmites australis TaxID=29695 RepID=UPI002D7A0618|nr:nitrogen regulatory protein P-II homolog isoform X1 [Phragmites australis]